VTITTSAKQRLWIRCLGYPVGEDVDWSVVRQYFDDASSSGRYQQPVTEEQAQLAMTVGLDIRDCRTAGDAAGVLYELLLSMAFVYSVYRQIHGLKGDRYNETGLPADLALELAHQIRGHTVEFSDIATTGSYDGDVFFRMSGKARNTDAYRHISERFSAAPASPLCVQATPAISQAQPTGISIRTLPPQLRTANRASKDRHTKMIASAVLILAILLSVIAAIFLRLVVFLL
jgi:hypothetical protein